MDIILALAAVVGTIAAVLGAIFNYAQLRRTPKPIPKSETTKASDVTILGVPMHRVRNLPGCD